MEFLSFFDRWWYLESNLSTSQIFDGTTSLEGSGSGNIFFRPPSGISYTNSVRVYNMTGGVNVNGYLNYLNGSNVLEKFW